MASLSTSLGAVIEKITGKTLGGYLAEAVWKPLGMADTGFHIDPCKARSRSQSVSREPARRQAAKNHHDRGGGALRVWWWVLDRDSSRLSTLRSDADERRRAR